MIPSVKAKWVAALRSGKYKQARGRLRKINAKTGEARHCCLGVLCELYVEETGKTTNMDRGTPLSPVVFWAGLDGACANLPGGSNLAVKNDKGASFAQIANIIESNL